MATDQSGRLDDGDERYAGITIGDDEYVIYDRENHQAWIQSKVTVRPQKLR